MIPVAIAGLIFKQHIEKLFNGNLLLIGSLLLSTAVVLAIAHYIKKDQRKIGYADAFILGIAQVLAVAPGISRSGITIAAGLIIGNKKEDVARFSFLMVLIPIIGANILEIFNGHYNEATVGVGIILTGFISAFISGYIACKWMITLVKKSKLIGFSIYCAIVGLILIFLG
jgi:undecaprenyl-diphosphatase